MRRAEASGGSQAAMSKVDLRSGERHDGGFVTWKVLVMCSERVLVVKQRVSKGEKKTSVDS